MIRRILAALALVAILASCGGDTASSGKVLDGSFQRFDGTTASFTEYRGKPVVVNFFSSTCIPCQAEMPALERLHRQLGDKVAFIGMNVNDTVEGGKAFADTIGVTYDLGRDPRSEILQGKVGCVLLPCTVLLNENGEMVYTHIGALTEDQVLGELRNRGLVE